MALFLESSILELLILVITYCSYLYYKHRTSTSKFWSKRNIPHLPPVFLVGNDIDKINKRSMGQGMAEYYNEHKEKKVLGYWAFTTPVLAVFDTGILKNVLVRDFSHFGDRMGSTYAEHDPLTGNLFNLEGQKWRNMRVHLTPTFTSGKMKMMYSTISRCGDELQEFLTEPANAQEEIEIKDILARFTTNVIASCAFGIEANALKHPDIEFRVQGKKLFELTGKQLVLNLICFAFPRLRDLFKIKVIPKDTTEFFMKIVTEVIEYRTKNNIKKNDFMQLLIELYQKGKVDDVDKERHNIEDFGVIDQKFTIAEAAAQAFVFFAAGFESSSTNMTFTLYELANNPEVQKKVKDEVKSAIAKEGWPLSYETITKLQYLDWTVQESLRKYPVVPVLFRKVTKEYYLEEFRCTLPLDTLIAVSLLGMSRDPEFFPDPEKFDPTRFSPENVSQRNHFANIPFGEGPRSCIGNRFGLLQTKVGLVSILSKYTVKLSEATPKTLKYVPKAFVLTVEGGMPLKLRKDD